MRIGQHRKTTTVRKGRDVEKNLLIFNRNVSYENAKQAIFFTAYIHHAYVRMASDNCETIISSVNVQMARLLSMFTYSIDLPDLYLKTNRSYDF